jgi:O-methyltransferase involved in polyketide biosynthesis
VLDVWTSEFLVEHPDEQVVHLGCGSDSRPLRVPRPEAARWIDFHYPGVTELRRRRYRLPEQVETVGVSVTDPSLARIVSSERR